ncbi:uncharacterized protein G2W53_039327 [Senna tora]|uniref:Uncharacterized protein n=1 Tax=Senna tora TaxID=362788 RepID=A0A834SPD7_9FABA|nr:uncharacterized protein G2W53_039327 [Senna tora]
MEEEEGKWNDKSMNIDDLEEVKWDESKGGEDGNPSNIDVRDGRDAGSKNMDAEKEVFDTNISVNN